MKELCLVTGANGHLGNNIVRALLNRGYRVRGTVRNLQNRAPFVGLNCEIVYADLLDRQSWYSALSGVDVVIHAAGVVQQWARNPGEQIIKPNVDGTRNIVEIAAQQGVSKIIYVGSIAALEFKNSSGECINETTWNTKVTSPYYLSKTLAEKLALRLAKEHELPLLSVLPGALIGPHMYGHFSEAMKGLYYMLRGLIPFDINIYIPFVDIRDVATAIVTAIEKGRAQQRYLLTAERPLSTRTVARVIKSLRKNTIYFDIRIPRAFLQLAALLAKAGALLTGTRPLLTLNHIDLYYGKSYCFDISRARNELDFNPRSPEQAVKEACEYLITIIKPQK